MLKGKFNENIYNLKITPRKDFYKYSARSDHISPFQITISPTYKRKSDPHDYNSTDYEITIAKLLKNILLI